MSGSIQLIKAPFFVPALDTLTNPAGLKVFGSTGNITGLSGFFGTTIVSDFSSTFGTEIAGARVA